MPENPTDRREAVIASIQKQFGEADPAGSKAFWEKMEKFSNDGKEALNRAADWLRHNVGTGTAEAAELPLAEQKKVLQSPEGRGQITAATESVARRVEANRELTLGDQLDQIEICESPTQRFEMLLRLAAKEGQISLDAVSHGDVKNMDKLYKKFEEATVDFGIIRIEYQYSLLSRVAAELAKSQGNFERDLQRAFEKHVPAVKKEQEVEFRSQARSSYQVASAE